MSQGLLSLGKAFSSLYPSRTGLAVPRALSLSVPSSGTKMSMASCSRLARRVLDTDTPVMVQILKLEDLDPAIEFQWKDQMQELLRGLDDYISLAQGVVYWQPPTRALEKIKESVFHPSVSSYGADDGLPELRSALLDKLKLENKLSKSSVMVTAGANQGFVNLVLTLCDAGDSVVMFAPYYFNAYMSFQMTGVTDIIIGPSNSETLQPDADWLEEILSPKDGKPVPKLVTVVNPGNPSGAYVPEPLLQRISEMCRKAGSWFVVDNTYEYFMYNGLKHVCIEGDHILNLFSFSKAYGMMGWRVGYIAYPTAVEGLRDQLLKVQDNIPICASIIGQKLALHCLEEGPEWVHKMVEELSQNIDILLDALSPLGKGAVKGGDGAIYLWARLPSDVSDDVAVVHWLAKKHGVVVIPGSASGGPGYIRVSFGGVTKEKCQLAAARLRKGIEELVEKGMLPY